MADTPADQPSREVLETVLDPDTVVEEITLADQPRMRTVLGGRHEARERAIHLLYEASMKMLPPKDVIAAQVMEPDPYAVDLVDGVATNLAELDEIIGRLARGWTIQRMPTMDVVVLRLALFELIHRPDVPSGVILAEAVEFASDYGTDDSAKFVNGLLAAARDEIRQ